MNRNIQTATRNKNSLAARIVFVAGLVGALAVPILAKDEEPAQWVIPPGQEELLGKMLGAGEKLPGGCRLAKGDIQYSVINAVYNCDGKDVSLELAHPSQSKSAAGKKTAKFAISASEGAAPDALLDALVERAKASEGDFAWQVSTANDPVPYEQSFAGKLTEGPMLYVAGAAALLVIAVLGFILRRA